MGTRRFDIRPLLSVPGALDAAAPRRYPRTAVPSRQRGGHRRELLRPALLRAPAAELGRLPRMVLRVLGPRRLPQPEPCARSWFTAMFMHGGWDHFLGHGVSGHPWQERRGRVRPVEVPGVLHRERFRRKRDPGRDLGVWFVYQLIEANYGLVSAAATRGGVAFFAPRRRVHLRGDRGGGAAEFGRIESNGTVASPGAWRGHRWRARPERRDRGWKLDPRWRAGARLALPIAAVVQIVARDYRTHRKASTQHVRRRGEASRAGERRIL